MVNKAKENGKVTGPHHHDLDGLEPVTTGHWTSHSSSAYSMIAAQGDYVGFNTGNGEKLCYSQADPG